MDILGIISIPNWLLILIGLGVALYVFLTWNFDRFTKIGIPGPKPYPLIGTSGPIFTEGVIKSDFRRYREYGRLYGGFLGRQPIFITSDDELMSEVFVKKFNCFPNRRGGDLIRDSEDIVFNFLTSLTDENWKRVRNLLTPTFTSGKLKGMVSSINRCAKDFAENILSSCSADKTFDTKEISGCYTMDVIGTTAFGIEVNSQKDPNNEFVLAGKKAFTMQLRSPLVIISIFFPFLMPLARKMKLGLFDPKTVEFFRQVIAQAIKERKANPEAYKGKTDFVQLMINAHNESVDAADQQEVKEFGATFDNSAAKKGMRDIEILANGVLFFLAGFDTTAQTLSFLLYRMAIHPEIQEKLYQDIVDVVGDKEDVSYDDIQKLPYLDWCVKESLRMYPVGAMVDRQCTQDVTAKGIDFKKGDVVAISINCLHYDETRWPNPEEFRPERFSPEESATRGPFDWMPFGYGPRNCIGMRLALLEAKIGVIQVLRKMKLLPCDKTKIPLKLDPIGYRVTEGIWITAEKR